MALVLFLVGILGIVISAFNPTWKRLGTPPLTTFGVTVALLSLCYLFFHWVGISLIAGNCLNEQDLRMRAYHRVLEELAIREEAEGRISSAKRRYQEVFGRDPRLIETPSELHSTEQRTHLAKFVRGLDKTDDPATIKRLLGTIRLFDEVLSPGSAREQRVLESANLVTEKNFASASEFFKWLEENDDSSWKPVPLYDFSY